MRVKSLLVALLLGTSAVSAIRPNHRRAHAVRSMPDPPANMTGDGGDGMKSGDGMMNGGGMTNGDGGMNNKDGMKTTMTTSTTMHHDAMMAPTNPPMMNHEPPMMPPASTTMKHEATKSYDSNDAKKTHDGVNNGGAAQECNATRTYDGNNNGGQKHGSNDGNQGYYGGNKGGSDGNDKGGDDNSDKYNNGNGGQMVDPSKCQQILNLTIIIIEVKKTSRLADKGAANINDSKMSELKDKCSKAATEITVLISDDTSALVNGCKQSMGDAWTSVVNSPEAMNSPELANLTMPLPETGKETGRKNSTDTGTGTGKVTGSGSGTGTGKGTGQSETGGNRNSPGTGSAQPQKNGTNSTLGSNPRPPTTVITSKATSLTWPNAVFAGSMGLLFGLLLV